MDAEKCRPMKVIVAVDGSPGAKHAVKSVAARPWPNGSVFRVVSVFDAPLPSNAAGGGIPREFRARYREAAAAPARATIARAVTTLRKAGLTIDDRTIEGNPARAIVEHAGRWGADLVVIGSRGLTRARRFLLGSVASYVAANAPCSVEIVRKTKQ
jgi:nucleotide-binding universal stress UspA family protein